MKSCFILFLVGLSIFARIDSFAQDSSTKVYSIKFSGYKTHLSKEAKATLSEVAEVLKKSPDWNFEVIGNCGGSENQRVSTANWDRVNNIIIHLVEKLGIKADRAIFKYGPESGDCNLVDISFTTDSITTVPPPHPNLRKKPSQE